MNSIYFLLTIAKAPAHTAIYGSINKRQIGVPFGFPLDELLEKSNVSRRRVGRITTNNRTPSSKAIKANVINGTRLPKNSYRIP